MQAASEIARTDWPSPLDRMTTRSQDVLSRYVEEIRHPRGEPIFRIGDESDGFYIIDDGLVRIELDAADRDPDEQDNVLAFLEPGTILGELSLLDELPRSASAVAQTDLRLRKVSRDALELLKRDHPEVGMALIGALGRAAALKLRSTSGRLDNLIASKRDPVVEEMISRAEAAMAQIQDWPERRIDDLTFALARAVEAEAEALATLAVEETGMGDAADKTMKNRVASLGVWHSFNGRRGAGVVAAHRLDGVLEVACPAGVIFAVVPATNPTSTFIFKTLIAIKSRNAVILSPNRDALGCCGRVGEIVVETLARHGAPVDLVQWISGRGGSRKQVVTFMGHPRIALVLATGGPSLVKAAYSSGNPAIGVGSGNAPTLICADADVAHAAASVAASKSFDNGLICGAEHNLLAVAAIRDRFVAALEANGVAVLDPAETARFHERALDARRGGLSGDLTGRPAREIAERIGVERPFPIRVIVVPDARIAKDNPLSREKMAPVLSLYTVADETEGFDAARRLLEIDGLGHTAIIHTRDRARARRFGEAMTASRILVNSPGAHGVVGMSTGLSPSLTLGCGTFGGTSTTDNVTYTHVRNIKRIAFYSPGRLMLLSDTAMRMVRRRSLMVSKVGRALSWLRFRKSSI
ncbi:aldehyde dehydrogenase family protein [Albimonas sp. CAU 1670]|uniref:aldehyde dehydrogenase family protein n=1 Tax=Albimonas sp. CAU 1670 TaxID=3032599 RepID=UPI0023D98278|nr:aldehyde dehydrogenase family protein [Albimonas sp. CAU 1670]MDF2235337.1 aldehyde dehydrogenase family protein [Albimonas sp. CAU 1670]